MNKKSGFLWGIIFIFVGIVWGLNAFDMIHINLFFKGWWTLFIIVPSLVGLFNDRDKVSNIIGLVIGVFLFLMCQGLVTFDIAWKLVVPTILIFIGLSFIFKDVFSGKVKKIKNSNLKEYYATFSSQRVDYVGEVLDGVSLNATFGELNFDLNKAKLGDDVVIDVSSVFGSIILNVPDDVVIKTNATSVFGKVFDSRKNKSLDGKKIIYINGLCIFGGVEVR